MTTERKTEKVSESSTVRENLMTRPGYSPYCGAGKCSGRWPRTFWNGSQFDCRACGWQSEFPADFVARYKTVRPTHPAKEG